MITNEKLVEKMISVSSLYNVRKVKAPTLLLLGKKDIRVPISQGLSYYHALREVGVTTR